MTYPITFDATVGISAKQLSIAGFTGAPDAALAAVRKAMTDLPGAGFIDVEMATDAPASLDWITVYQPGSSRLADAATTASATALVDSAIISALRSLKPD